MRFCTNCGSRLPEGANFCIECGAPAGAPEKTTRLERPEGTPSDEGAANAAAPDGADQRTTVMPAAVQAPVSVLDETRRASRANAEGAHAGAGTGVGAGARAGAAPATDNPYLQGEGQTAGTQSKAKAKPSALKPALIGGGIGLAFVLGLGIAFAVSGANANKEAAPAPQVQEQQKGDDGASAKAGENAAGAADESSSNDDVKPRASVEQYSWGELGKVAQKMYAAGLGGEIDIGAGATLQNDVAAGYCPIYGTLKGTGSLAGPFRFTGTTNCWEVADAGATRSTLPCVQFANPTKETFAGLKSLSLTFNGRPTRRAYYLTTATVADLTEADLAGTVLTVTGGECDYSANFTLTVVGGRLALANSKPAGTYIIVR